MTADKSWVQPYTQEVGDNFRLGFDLKKCWSVSLDEKATYNVDAQMSWLATVLANKFLQFALANPEDREQVTEYDRAEDNGTEQNEETL